MKYLILDTETTGLPKSRNPFEFGPENWPHIVSISWIILNTDTNTIDKQRYYIIRPAGWAIPDDSVKIHGINMAKATLQGHDLKTVLSEFLSEKVEAIVAHNMDFDYNVICSAIRWDLEFIDFKGLPYKRYCTMELSKDICNLKTTFGKPKYPKLMELYEYTFKRPPIPAKLHNSLYDTKILTEIVQHCDKLRLKMNLYSLNEHSYNQNEHPKNGSGILSIYLGPDL